jgi:hypothetical protein
MFNVSPFLQHVFNPDLQHVRNRSHPVFTVLLKILPQRSQYKFFVTLMNQCIHSPDFLFFIKSILFSGYTGFFYSWNSPHLGIPLHRMFQLYEFFCIQPINWPLYIESNIRIIFFMIKEYVCFFIRLNPGLHSVLLSHLEWGTHEHHIFQTMNTVRALFYKNTVNPHRHMLLSSQKNTLPSTQLYPHPSSSYQTLRLKALELLIERFPTIQTKDKVNFSSYSLLRKFANTQRFHVTDFFHRYIEESRFNLDISIKINSLSYYDYVWILATELVQHIHCFCLPAHHYNFQLRALNKRFDIPLHDLKRLYTSSMGYFCFSCSEFTSNGFHSQHNRLSDSRSFALGHTNLFYDPLFSFAYCSGTHRQRKTTSRPLGFLKCPMLPCIQIPLLGSVVSFLNKSYTLCYTCGVPTSSSSCYFTASTPSPSPLCTFCSSHNTHSTSTSSEFCIVCLRPAKRMRSICLYDDTQIHHGDPWSVASLCHRHFHSSWTSHTIVLKSSLSPL